MAKAVRTAFEVPVVKAPEPLLWCSSRQADQSAISMNPCSAACPFVAEKTAEQVPRISAPPTWLWRSPEARTCKELLQSYLDRDAVVQS